MLQTVCKIIAVTEVEIARQVHCLKHFQVSENKTRALTIQGH